MNTLYLDLETYSPTDIKKGVYKYVEDVEILLCACALNDGPVAVWDVTNEPQKIPDDLFNFYVDKSTFLCAHNSGFDRVVLEKVMPKLVEGCLWRDTMVRAYSHGLPGGLAMLSQIYQLPESQAKDKEGKRLIYLFCKPQRDGTRATKKTHPQEWKKFIEYARHDIEAMRALDKKLPEWNSSPEEYKNWQLDQKINGRGFQVDVELAQTAISSIADSKKKNDALTVKLTNNMVQAATQRDAMLKYLLEIHNVDLPDMTISTLTRRLEDPDLSEPIKDLINLRLLSSSTSIKKYSSLLNSANIDGRLRGTLQFCGASRTGRWSGRIFQPHNLPRPKYKNKEIELGIEALKTNCAGLIYGDELKDITSSAIRGVIVAAPGKKLVVADLSSIEGRMLAWLAGETWKIEAYYDYDLGAGFDMYVLTYARTFNIKPEDVTPGQRQLGKVLELALGYGGGVGAFVTFANGYNIDLRNLADRIYPILPEETKLFAFEYWERCVKDKKTLGLPENIFVACESVKRLWRDANPKIVQLWKDIEDATYGALLYGRTVKGKHFVVDKKGTWLRIQLPSGRYLCYAGVGVENKKIRYLGVDQYSRKWCRLSTYGGKLAENITQASSRDVLAHGMQLAESKGYEIVLSVHDELLTETPDNNIFTHKELSALMSTPPEWATGLPLAATGFESHRYRKG